MAKAATKTKTVRMTHRTLGLGEKTESIDFWLESTWDGDDEYVRWVDDKDGLGGRAFWLNENGRRQLICKYRYDDSTRTSGVFWGSPDAPE